MAAIGPIGMAVSGVERAGTAVAEEAVAAAPAVVEAFQAGAHAIASETTTLYRVVTSGELEQIRQTGQFEAGQNSLAGKWFAEIKEHAQQWAI